MDLILTSGLLLSFIDPSDLEGKKLYSSGIKEVDKYHYDRWGSTPNPLLKIPYHFFNEEFKICSPGVYDASIEHNKIVLVQGSQVKAILNASVEKTDEYLEIPKAFVKQEQDYTVITVFQDGKKAIAKLGSSI